MDNLSTPFGFWLKGYNSKIFSVIYIPRIIPLFLLIFLVSCEVVPLNNDSAKLSLFNSASKKAFSFVVSEEFVRKNSHSESSALYPKMNVAELKLLMKFLQHNKYCINKNGELSFKINSRQEKIYDVTFSSLIEQSYNAKPVSPTTYFGECV